MECRLFSDGKTLYETCASASFDLLLLDIEMQGTDGFILAKQIAAEGKNCSMIFVSRHENLVFDSWQYSPLWFVRKSMLEHDMRLAVRKFAGLFEADTDRCLFTGKGGAFEQYGSLKVAEKELSASHFLRIHKSYLVNPKYIREIGKREVLLTDGACLEMGRDRRKELLSTMERYRRDHREHR